MASAIHAVILSETDTANIFKAAVKYKQPFGLLPAEMNYLL